MILYVLLRFISPRWHQRLRAKIVELEQKQRVAVGVLRLYGLRKFVGVIAAFVIIFTLYVGQQLVWRIGELVPGQIGFNPDALMRGSVTHEQLMCILAQFPVENVDELHDALDAKIKAAQAKLPATDSRGMFQSGYWKEKSSAAQQAFNVIKAFSLISFLFMMVEIWVKRDEKKKNAVTQHAHPIPRFLVCAIVLGIAGGIALMQYLYAIQQEFYAAARDAQLLAALDGTECHQIPFEKRWAIERKMWRMYTPSGRWWDFEVFDPWYFRWFVEEVLGRHSFLSTLGTMGFVGSLHLEKGETPRIFDPPEQERLAQAAARDAEAWAGIAESKTVEAGFQALWKMGYIPESAAPSDQRNVGSLVILEHSTPPKLHDFGGPQDLYLIAPMQVHDVEDVPSGITSSLNCKAHVAVVSGDLNPLGTPSEWETHDKDLFVVHEILYCNSLRNDKTPLVAGFKIAHLQ